MYFETRLLIIANVSKNRLNCFFVIRCPSVMVTTTSYEVLQIGGDSYALTKHLSVRTTLLYRYHGHAFPLASLRLFPCVEKVTTDVRLLFRMFFPLAPCPPPVLPAVDGETSRGFPEPTARQVHLSCSSGNIARTAA